jgi:hypothetical protein
LQTASLNHHLLLSSTRAGTDRVAVDPRGDVWDGKISSHVTPVWELTWATASQGPLSRPLDSSRCAGATCGDAQENITDGDRPPRNVLEPVGTDLHVVLADPVVFGGHTCVIESGSEPLRPPVTKTTMSTRCLVGVRPCVDGVECSCRSGTPGMGTSKRGTQSHTLCLRNHRGGANAKYFSG